MKNGKLQSIIAIRGVAVLLVMFCHFFSETALGVTSAHLKEVTSAFGHMGVTLFFIVSGFVLPYSLYKSNYSIKRFPKYLFRRSIRIEPPYIASIIIVLLCMCLKLLIGQTVNYKGGLWGILSQLLYLNDILGLPWLNVVYWTLALEFQFYILLGVLFPLLKEKCSWLLLVGLLLFCSFKFLGNEFYWITYYLPFFIIGFGFCAYQLKKITSWQLGEIVVISLLINLYHNGQLYSILDSVTVIIFSCFYILENKGFPKWLLFVGEISYSIYLIHNIFVFGICVLNPLHLGLNFRIIICMVALLISFWPCYLFYKFIERPFHLQAQRIRRR